MSTGDARAMSMVFEKWLLPFANMQGRMGRTPFVQSQSMFVPFLPSNNKGMLVLSLCSVLGHLSLHGAGDARVAQREARQAIFRLDTLPIAMWYAAIWKALFCCTGVWSFFTEEKKVACWTFLDKPWQGASGIVTKLSFERVEHLLCFVLDQLLNRMFRHVVSPVYIGLRVRLRLDTVLARKGRALTCSDCWTFVALT